MKGTDLEEVLGVVFAENIVPHMITRKAISTAVRGHFFAQSALVTNLFKLFIDDGKDEAEGNEDDISVEEDEETVKREDVLRQLENITNTLGTRGKQQKMSKVKITQYCLSWKI